MRSSKTKAGRRKVTGSKDRLPESEIEMDEPDVVAENEARGEEKQEQGM